MRMNPNCSIGVEIHCNISYPDKNIVDKSVGGMRALIALKGKRK